MKLHRLELTGFGPFRETQTVDFDAFDADGVFLISGRTGAGKSSILDGVSFALYGAVPRYEGGERRLRSDHCFLGDPTEVRLEFSVGERRWRVTRAPEYDRPAKRGGGLTTEPTRAELEERVGDVWVGRAAKPREVGVLLDEEIGLSAQQFQQVILLAQNKFSRFLLAANDERQALLRTLFGTRRFERYTEELEQRRRDAQKARDAGDVQTGAILDVAERLIDAGDLAASDPRPADVAGRRAAAEQALRRAEYRSEVAATARALADEVARSSAAALAKATARAADLEELAAARARLDALEGEAPQVAAERERLARGQRAEALRATIDAADRAATAHTAAVDHVATAHAAWRDGGGDGDIDAEIDRLTGDLALWSVVAERERTLPAAEALLETQTDARDRHAVQLAALDAEIAALPQKRAALDADLAAETRVAAGEAELRSQLSALQLMIDGAIAAAQLADRERTADADYARENAAAAAAAAAVTALLQRRLAGYAGELAADLVEGEPCAVCGATEHPHPAVPTDAPVTADELTAAEAARDLASERAVAAGDRARAAREAHAAATVRAGGRPLPELEADARRTEEAHRRASAAALRVSAVTAARADLDAAAGALDAARAERAADHAQAALAQADTARTVAELRAESAGARGDFAAVADRVDDAVARRSRARAAAAARDALAEQVRALTAALADRDHLIAASDFDDVAGAVAALLDDAERARLDQRVTEHATALAAVRSRVLTLELDTVDGSHVDLAAATEAAAAADAARAAAIGAERDAHNAAARLGELLADVDAAAAGTSALAEEAAVVTRLADTVAGRAPNTMKMELETFVLAAELEEIVAAANLRLSEMSAGRYTLHHSDARAARGRSSGLAIEVLDAYTGRLRSPQSLSGGETFLASLALALGLAEVVTARAGGIRLDTLFVDEGFGSLDPETLELAMRTLDELRAGGRTVGVISHVEAMKEQLPAQVVVESVGQGPSAIRQDLPVTA